MIDTLLLIVFLTNRKGALSMPGNMGITFLTSSLIHLIEATLEEVRTN